MNYIQQAYKGKRELWMFLLTAFLISGVFIINFIVFLRSSKEDMEAAYQLMKALPTNINLITNLLPFMFLLGLLFVLVKYIHRRSILSLTTTRKKLDFKRFFLSLGAIITIIILSFALSYYTDPSQIVFQFNPTKFIVLVLISCLLFPFQIALEEYLFRGYLMQHLGVLLKNKWFPLCFTSLMFGLAHSANPEVAEMGYISMVFYIGTGLFLGIMTLMDDGLELALGFHLGNNLMTALLITSDWSALQTDALFKYTAEEANMTVLEILLPVFVVYPLLLLMFSKIYKWTNWKDKLFGKVIEP